MRRRDPFLLHHPQNPNLSWCPVALQHVALRWTDSPLPLLVRRPVMNGSLPAKSGSSLTVSDFVSVFDFETIVAYRSYLLQVVGLDYLLRTAP